MNTILVPIDFSEATPVVVETACQMARAFSAKLVLVNVIRPSVYVSAYGPLLQGLEEADAKVLSDDLVKWRDRLEDEGLSVDSDQSYGDPATCIRVEAEKVNADCIVIGSHGHGAMFDLLVGSTASALLKNAPCPVLIVPARGKRVFQDAPVPAAKAQA